LNRIKELREARGILQQELADIVGVSSLTISRYENGQREPKLDIMVKLADYFEVSLAYILGINSKIAEDGIFIRADEYDRLKEIERKYYKIMDVIDTF